jgi:hypothetical protein
MIVMHSKIWRAVKGILFETENDEERRHEVRKHENNTERNKN